MNYVYDKNSGELYHFGVKGMKWGVRRQREQSGTGGKRSSKKDLTPEQKAARRKKALKVGAAVVGTALAAYGAMKFKNAIRDKNLQIQIEKGRKSVAEYAKNMYRRADAHLYDPVFKGPKDSHADYLRNIDKSIAYATRQEFDAAHERAKGASFGKALKNVYQYERDRRRRR